MKTISKLSLVLVFALASLNTYAVDGDFLLNVKKGISKTYSLEEFPEGKYILVVENNLKTVKHEITISKKETVLNRKAIAEVYKNSPKKYLAVANN